jgi:hypothetical protein
MDIALYQGKKSLKNQGDATTDHEKADERVYPMDASFSLYNQKEVLGL